jgi:hypothetical protein
MLLLKTDPIFLEEDKKLRDWILDTQCDMLIKAVSAEEMALQSEYANAALKNPLEAIALVGDHESARKILRKAARLAIFLEVLNELRDPQHAFVNVRLETVPQPTIPHAS